jgi:hypothetical protein
MICHGLLHVETVTDHRKDHQCIVSWACTALCSFRAVFCDMEVSGRVVLGFVPRGRTRRSE